MPLKRALQVNCVVFLCLFGSAFAWNHEASQFNNAWLVGMLGCMFANLAEDVPEFRFANASLGIWLIASVWVLPAQTVLTLWTSTTVGILAQVALLTSVTEPRSGAERANSAR